MTPERFETLAEAFGGDVARWPPAEREAAAALMTADPAWAGGVLSRAGDLDATLSALSAPRAGADLTDRIIATAPPLRGRASWTRWMVPAGMGAGLAAACVAGMVLGARLSTPPVTDNDAVAAASDDAADVYLDEEA